MQTTSKDLFEILAREHAGTLLAYLRSTVRDASTVDDLFQETMLTAWKNLDSFDRTRPFGPWLRGIAGKLVLAHFRKDARLVRVGDEVVLDQISRRLESLHQMTGDTLDEKLDHLRRCLDVLPQPFRQAVDLRYVEGLKGASLADRLELSVENVKKRLQRARKRLLECMEQRMSAVGYPA